MNGTTFLQRAEALSQKMRLAWADYWLLRWVVLNIVGWSVGLLAFALMIAWLGLVGVPLGLLLAGFCIGLAQYYAHALNLPRGWLWWSLGGVLLGAPGFLLIVPVIVVNKWVGWLLMGALFGGIFGGMQTAVLHKRGPGVVLVWVIANMIAGLACAPLTFGVLGVLPIMCMPGLLLFALITAYAVNWVRQQPLEKPDN